MSILIAVRKIALRKMGNENGKDAAGTWMGDCSSTKER